MSHNKIKFSRGTYTSASTGNYFGGQAQFWVSTIDKKIIILSIMSNICASGDIVCILEIQDVGDLNSRTDCHVPHAREPL